MLGPGKGGNFTDKNWDVAVKRSREDPEGTLKKG